MVDQHGVAEAVTGEEPQQFDPVHPRHAEVERDHIGVVRLKRGAKLVVVGGDRRRKAADARSLGHERRKRRFVVNQQDRRSVGRIHLPSIGADAAQRNGLTPDKTGETAF